MKGTEVRLARKTAHQFLRMAGRALPMELAKDRIRNFMRIYNLDLDAMLASGPDATVTLTDDHGKATVFTYRRLLRETARTGVIPEGDRLVWRLTNTEGTISAGTNADEFPEMVLSTASGRHTTTPLEAPGYISNDVMSSLLDDVLVYRRLAVRHSFFDGSLYESCFRAYRAYLVACISAVDAFLNEWSWFTLNDPSRSLKPEERATLSQRRSALHTKLTDWPPIITGSCILCSSVEWKDFEKIRVARNSVVHVNSPEFNFSLRKAAEVLNHCRKGVGGLLMLLERVSRRYPTPRMYGVRFAPLVSFRPKQK